MALTQEQKNAAQLLKVQARNREHERKLQAKAKDEELSAMRVGGKENAGGKTFSLPQSPKYNAEAVQKAINRDPKIKGKEAKTIHSLLKGRTGDGKPVTTVEAVYAQLKREDLPVQDINRKVVEEAVAAGMSARDIIQQFRSEFMDESAYDVKPVGDAPKSEPITKGVKVSPIVATIPRSKRPGRDEKVKLPIIRMPEVLEVLNLTHEQWLGLGQGQQSKLLKKAVTELQRKKSAKDASGEYSVEIVNPFTFTNSLLKIKAASQTEAEQKAEIVAKKRGPMWRVKTTDASPFDRDSDVGSALQILAEMNKGLKAKEIAAKYGYSIQFVLDVGNGKFGKTAAAIKKAFAAEDVKPVGDALENCKRCHGLGSIRAGLQCPACKGTGKRDYTEVNRRFEEAKQAKYAEETHGGFKKGDNVIYHHGGMKIPTVIKALRRDGSIHIARGYGGANVYCSPEALTKATDVAPVGDAQGEQHIPEAATFASYWSGFKTQSPSQKKVIELAKTNFKGISESDLTALLTKARNGY